MRSKLPGTLIALAVLIAGFAVAFLVGRFPISLGDIAAVLWSKLSGAPSGVSSAIEAVILQVRGPRVVAAFLVGAALAIAGTAFQGLFRNPLVSPDILGASSGAALGAVLGIYFSLGVFAIQAFAFAGGLVAVGAVYAIGSAIRTRDPVLVLVLAGVVIGSLLGAGIGLVKYLADPYNQLPAMTFWLLGSLAAANVSDLVPLFGPVLARQSGAARVAAPHERDVASRRRGACARRADRTVADRDRGGGDIGDIGQRGGGRHYRLGRTGGAASGALAGRSGLCAAVAGQRDPRRRFPAVHRYAGAHDGAGRGAARDSDGGGRYAVFHLAAGAGEQDMVVSTMTIEGRDLSIGYPERLVGSGLNVRLAQGEVLALLGPNGGGKTTLLKTLLGLIPARAGEVRVMDRPLDTLSAQERARIIGYVPQVHHGTFAFTVESVVLMGRTAHGSLFAAPTAHDREASLAALERFGIAALSQRAYTEISGGERQLVLLARALARSRASSCWTNRQQVSTSAIKAR